MYLKCVILRAVVIIVTICIGASSALAQSHPVTLYYTVEADSAGKYDYTFTLEVTGTPPGELNWITWADIGSSAGSHCQGMSNPLLTSSAPAPFSGMSMSYGGHAGPTWLNSPSPPPGCVHTISVEFLLWYLFSELFIYRW